MSRAPTDRTEAWAPWRRRLAGERVEITHEPQCGLYRRKSVGRFIGVQIDLEQTIDPDTGELIGDERFVAWADGEPVDAEAVWTWCAGNPITQAEFDALAGRRAVRDLSREVILP